MLSRTLATLAVIPMLSGCAAALLAPSLAVGGGSYALINKSRKDAIRDTRAGSRPIATAEAIGRNVDPRDVRLYDIKEDKRGSSWMADTPVGRFSCSASDTNMALARCVRK